MGVASCFVDVFLDCFWDVAGGCVSCNFAM